MTQLTAEQMQKSRAEFMRAALQGMATKSPPLNLLQIQSRADAAFELHGHRAPGPTFGEDANHYRRRLLSLASTVAPFPWNSINPWTQPDTALDSLERDVIDGAVREFEKPEGPLRSIVRHDEAGRPMRYWYGDPENCWGRFKGNVNRYATGMCDIHGRPSEPWPVEMKMSDGSIRKVQL